MAHLLFLLGGFLLGISIAGLTMPDDPHVVRSVAGIVMGLCTLIIGQQSAAHDGRAEPDE